MASRGLIDARRLADLGRSIGGALVTSLDPEYDSARSVFNAMIDRRPAAIAMCRTAEDVATCVDFSRSTGVSLSVRGGGHNVSGNAVREGGLVIDMRHMAKVRVDVREQTAVAQGGATWRDFDLATQEHGLATPGGIVSTTGIGGLTLGGGIGVLRGLHGFTCDNLVHATLTTADGRTVVADEVENVDLLWALRGGGGNFGIAVELRYELHPVGEVIAGLVAFPFSVATELLPRYLDFMASAPDELNCDIGIKGGPDGQPRIVLIVAYIGAEAAAAKVLAPLTSLPKADVQLRKMSYCDAQRIHDVNWPFGRRHYWKSMFLTGCPPDAIRTIEEFTKERKSPLSAIVLEHFHGAVNKVPRESAAFDQRQAPLNLLIETQWVDPAHDAENVAWTRRFWDAMEAYSNGGVYVNYLGQEGESRIRAAYGPAKFARLAAIKRQYDPTNIFNMNQNIPADVIA
jgi:FAD/FMN-containing dehydrogenase